MARRVRSSPLETRSARLKLATRKKPYYTKLAEGLALGYRRNQGPGTWSLRKADGRGGNWIKVIAPADDYEGTAGALSYWEAQRRAIELATGTGGHGSTKLINVAEAVAEYESHLESEGGDTGNATRIKRHLTPALASRMVAQLDAKELKAWKLGLLKNGLSAGAATRNCKSMAAALSLAAGHDPRIKNRDAWRIGLASLPGSVKARKVIFPEDTVRKIVTVSAQEGERFQVLIEVLATTGCRPVQARRLIVADLLRDKLLVPRSKKGRNKRNAERETRAVPIPAGLAMRLKQMAGNRPADAPLLLRPDGEPWGKDDLTHAMRRTAKRAGLDPRTATPYCLRHSFITRSLLRGLPVAVVADQCDTSERQIRVHYARYISDHSDALTRAAMVDFDPVVPASKVVPMAR
jgi:integrase